MTTTKIVLEELEKNIVLLRKQLQALQDDLEQTEKSLEAEQNTVSELQITLNEKTARLWSQQDEINIKDARIDKLEAENERLRRELLNCGETLFERELTPKVGTWRRVHPK
ncbi:MAG: hypothetical protein ACR2QC_01435 [Gammaproteobacteria bacterium]